MKQKHQTKLIACSAALAVSVSAHAGLGGLNVKSHLNHPFSASVTVSGNEAQSLLNGGKVSISNSSLKTSIRPDGDKVVVHIRSAAPIREPILTFQLGVGAQTREYTAMLDPAGYDSTLPTTQTFGPNTNVATDRQAARERVRREVQRHIAAPARPSSRPSAISHPTKAAKAHTSQSTAPVFGQKYRIRSGETLNQIADRLHINGMSTEQIAQVLFAANPHAFINQQADNMLSGAYLTVPQRSAFQAQNRADEPSGHSVAAPKTTPASAPEASPSAASEAAAAPVQPAAVSAVAVSDVLPEPDVSQASAIAPAVENIAASTVAATPPASASSVEPAANAEDSASGVLSWRNMILAGGVALLLILLGLRQREKRRTVLSPSDAHSPEAASPIEADAAEWHKGLQQSQSIVAASATSAALASAAERPSETATVAVDKQPYSGDEFDDDDIVFTSISDEPDAESLKATPAAADNASSETATAQPAEASKLEWQPQNILQHLPSLEEDTAADSLDNDTTAGLSEWQHGLKFELPAKEVGNPAIAVTEVAQPATAASTDSDLSGDEVLLGQPWQAFSDQDDEALFPTESAQNHADAAADSGEANKPLEFVAAPVAENQTKTPTQDQSLYQSVVSDEGLPEEMWNYFPENDYNDLFPAETESSQDDAIGAADAENKLQGSRDRTADATDASQAKYDAVVVEDEAVPEAVWNYFPENDYSDLFPSETEKNHEQAAVVSEQQDTSAGSVWHSDATLGDQDAASESATDKEQDIDSDWQHRGIDEADDDSMVWQNLKLQEPQDVFTAETSQSPTETDAAVHADTVSPSNSIATPLDVRCDLAQMYIEIGDIESARETLQALLNDPDASVSAKAQTMLADLNTKNPPKLK